MAANIDPIFPKTPTVDVASLVSPTAVTSRADVSGTTGLTALTPTTTDGKRVDRIEVRSKGNSSAGIVFVWIYDGTNSRLFDELEIVAATPGNTTPAFNVAKDYKNLKLPSTYRLFVSVTVAQDLNVFAFGGNY